MPPTRSRLTFSHAAFLLLALCALGASIGFSQREADVAATIGFAALVASIVGFAFSALAGSALAYLRVDPVHAVHVLAVCSTATQLYAVWKIRDAIRWRTLMPMIAAGAATVPIGVWLLGHIDSDAYAIGLGLFLSAYGRLRSVASRGRGAAR